MPKFIELHQLFQNGFDLSESELPTMVDVSDIRTLYPRRREGTQSGTRLTFSNGRGFVVKESTDEIRQLAVSSGVDDFIPVTIIVSADDDAFDGNEVEGDVVGGISVKHVRSFNPRKENRVGTRITFRDGGGFAIREVYDEIKNHISLN